MATEGTDYDTRPLPPGWSLGYDEETQRSCYFHYGTSLPSISYTHPLDIDTGIDPSQMTSTDATNRRSSRPLPRPPGATPPFDSVPIGPPLSPPPVASPSGSPPTYSTLIAPPSPKLPTSSKQDLHQSFVMSNPAQKMSAAQQIYANSLVNRGPSLPTLPPPSLNSITPKAAPNRQSFYKISVAPFVQAVQPSPPIQRPMSPASTVSSVSSSHSPQTTLSQTYNTSLVPQLFPYSERSFEDEGQYLDAVNLNSTSLPQGHIEPEVPIPASITTQIHVSSVPQLNRNTVYHSNLNQPTRTLFDLKYVNAGGNKPKTVRNVTTSIKPPPDSGRRGEAYVKKHTRGASLPQTLVSSSHGGLLVPGNPAHLQGPANSAAHLPLSTTSPSGLVLPPPPPLLLNVQPQPQQQQRPISPVHPQSFIPSHPPLAPVYQRPPPHHPQQYSHPQQSPQSSYPPPPQHTSPPQQSTPQQLSHPQSQYQQSQQSLHNNKASSPPNSALPVRPVRQLNRIVNSITSEFARQMGRTAVQMGGQAILSSLGINSDDSNSNNGGGVILDPPSGSDGGDAGGIDPASVLDPTSTAAIADYASLSQDPGTVPISSTDPGAYAVPPQGLIPGASMDCQTTYAAGVEIDYHRHSNGNTGEQVQTSNHWDAHRPPDAQQHHSPAQTTLPQGAGQPYLIHQPPQALSHQAQPLTYNPYHYH